MSTVKEAPVVAAEKPTVVAPAKEKKTKAPKVNKSKSVKNVSHPPYFEMIKDALLALKEKGGSSPYAIAKHMEDKHKAVLPENFRKILGLQLKNSASKGKLIKVKASYKLSDSGKNYKAASKVAVEKKKPEKAKKAVAAKGVLKVKQVKKTKAAAAVGAKPKAKALQKTKKRAAPLAKAKAKQPKSIKSPAAKKAKKAAA